MYLTPEQLNGTPARGSSPWPAYPNIHITGSALRGLVERTISRSPGDRRWTATRRSETTGKYYRLTLEELDDSKAPPPHQHQTSWAEFFGSAQPPCSVCLLGLAGAYPAEGEAS